MKRFLAWLLVLAIALASFTTLASCNSTPEESTGKGEFMAVGIKGFYNPLRNDTDIDCDAGEAWRADTCSDYALLCHIDDSERGNDGA